jgi:MFS family permease
MLIVLYIVGFFSTFSDGFLLPVTPLYAAMLGASVSEVGFIVAVFSYVTALFIIPGGRLSDKAGPRNFMVMGLIVFTVAPLLYVLVTKPEQLLWVRIFHGLAPAFLSPTGFALAIALAPIKKRGEAVGWYTMSLHLGHMAGPITGGFVLTHFGFYAAFYACSAVAMLGLLVVFIRTGAFKHKAGENVTEGSFWNWLKQRPILGCLLTQFVIGFGMGNIAAYLPLYCQKIGVAGAGAGLILTALFASSALSRVPAGKLSDKIGRKPIIILGLIIAALGVASISQFQNLSCLVFSGILFGLGMGVSSPAMFALVAESSSADLMGLSMGTTAFCFHLGLAIGPTSMGYVAEATNFGTMFLLSASILGVGLLAIMRMLRSRQ